MFICSVPHPVKVMVRMALSCSSCLDQKRWNKSSAPQNPLTASYFPLIIIVIWNRSLNFKMRELSACDLWFIQLSIRNDVDVYINCLVEQSAFLGFCWEGWGQEEKGTTENDMAGWHHGLDGCESEWTPGVGDGQGGMVCCDSRVAKSQTRLSNWTELNWTER